MALTWVYLMQDKDTGFFKIGRSIDPRNRLKELCKQPTLQPRPNNFVLVEAWWADEQSETYLHNLFFRQRQRGEWFALLPEHRAQIEQLFDTHQPFSVAQRPGDLSQMLKAARQEIDRLRYDLESTKSMHTRYVEMISRRDKQLEQDRQAELTLAELEPVLEKPKPRKTFTEMMELTSLKKRSAG